jgi:hypothetical protein
MTIEAIDRTEYYNFAAERFEERHTALPQEVFNAMYDRFDGHTWYMQCMLNRLYGYNRDVDDELVNFTIKEITAESSYAYTDLLKAYTLGHVRLLKAIAKEGCVKEILAGDFIKRHNLRAASSVCSALKKLLNNELVYQTSNGYIVYDRFMSEWMRQLEF